MLTAASSTSRVVKSSFVRRSVTLQPGGIKSIGLGIYDSKHAMPNFRVHFEPDLEDAVAMSLERLDVPGHSRYMPFYKFKNSGSAPCTITVDCEGETAA